MELPNYWTDELKGLNVFGVIEDTVSKYPEILKKIKEYINEVEGEKFKK